MLILNNWKKKSLNGSSLFVFSSMWSWLVPGRGFSRHMHRMSTGYISGGWWWYDSMYIVWHKLPDRPQCYLQWDHVQMWVLSSSGDYCRNVFSSLKMSAILTHLLWDWLHYANHRPSLSLAYSFDIAVYCPAGFHIETDSNGEPYCEGCPLHTYKTVDDYYAGNCTECPSNGPGTRGRNTTSVDGCYYG